MLVNYGVTTPQSTSAINRLKVAYNDAYRILHGMPRYHSARESQIFYNIDSLYALQRKLLINLLNDVTYRTTFWLKMSMSSDCFYDSIYYAEVESSKTSSRTDFEVLGLEGQVLGLGFEASSPRKLACPRLEDSTIF